MQLQLQDFHAYIRIYAYIPIFYCIYVLYPTKFQVLRVSRKKLYNLQLDNYSKVAIKLK